MYLTCINYSHYQPMINRKNNNIDEMNLYIQNIPQIHYSIVVHSKILERTTLKRSLYFIRLCIVGLVFIWEMQVHVCCQIVLSLKRLWAQVTMKATFCRVTRDVSFDATTINRRKTTNWTLVWITSVRLYWIRKNVWLQLRSYRKTRRTNYKWHILLLIV
jgi:hypothetical protein